MPLEIEAPQLDTRTFEQIKRMALLRIPRYTPEWTDFNEGDPGVTLVELFAWLTEMMLYRMNQVPNRHRLKFLQMLGLELRPAQPAVTYLVFTPAQNLSSPPIVEVGSPISAQPPGADRPVIFETTAGLGLIGAPLANVQVFDGAIFTDVTEANQQPGAPYQPFGPTPQIGSALYLGFDLESTPETAQVFPQEMRWRVFLPQPALDTPALYCRDVTSAPPAPDVGLVWEYRPAENPNAWRRLQVAADESVAFTSEGAVQVQGPVKPARTEEGHVKEKRCWLRVRIASGQYAAGTVPQIDFIRPNVVEAVNLSTVLNETLGESTGTPDQQFTLSFSPVERGSITLDVDEDVDRAGKWELCDDFLSSGPDDQHFILNPATGEITFGDGRNGRIPAAGSLITVTRYRYGGGAMGNLAAGMINTPLTNLIGVESVQNERASTGGRDEQDVAEFVRCAPALMRSRGRAVTAQDYGSLAQEVGGVANAVALPLFHPDHPGIEVPGAVTVVIVPDTAARPPRPSADQRRQVCAYLNERRLLTTELYVAEPKYTPVRVEALIAAEPYASFDRVRNDVIKAINRALDPLVEVEPPEGEAQTVQVGQAAAKPVPRVKGRGFGLDFFPTSLYSVMMGVKNVRAVTNLVVWVGSTEYKDDTLGSRVKIPEDGLLYGADGHEISVTAYEDQ